MSIDLRQAPVVLFVTFPQVCLLDFTGPQSVFWLASVFMEQRGLPGYNRHTVSSNGGLIEAAEGVNIDTLPFNEFEGKRIDTIIVPGGPFVDSALPQHQATTDWIRTQAKLARRMASVCTGAFLLAEAGLLAGKRVATHWSKCDALQQRYPSLHVDEDAIYVQQDAVWTSAGVTTGIDMALALIEADCGRDLSMQVAKEMVMFLKRTGGHNQYSEVLQAQSKDTAIFDDLHLWLAGNLNLPDISVDMLATRVNMSPRNFSRVYKKKTGHSPYQAVELLRLEAARCMLESSRRNLDQIAQQCGFRDEERLRLIFHRHIGMSPSDYRKRFANGFGVNQPAPKGMANFCPVRPPKGP